MISEAQRKVTPQHLTRKAVLYVRQSTMRQVVENTESTERQYALRQRAAGLGWPIERIMVIDRDLGQSGASAADREGFKTLVTEVGLGHVGLVMSLEVSRLARNSMDWHRLLEICALRETLILDEDGIYDPTQFNDRLLLGLKGTMSEAELHVLKARLRGGLLNKARRGELKTPLPVGLVYDEKARVQLDPDRQVQQALHHFFATFRRTGSACASVRALRQEGVLFPRRLRGGPRRGELVWGGLTENRALDMLRNPRYAGAFAFGRTRQRQDLEGRTVIVRRQRAEWTLIRGAHAGYVTWEQYEENQQRLAENAQTRGGDHRRYPPREGPALLQGLVLCGVCGAGMSVRYHARGGRVSPDYVCRGRGNKEGETKCQCIPGVGIDDALGPLLFEALSPTALEVSLAVQQEIEGRLEEADQLRHKQVERARYEAEVARRRYMQVDPDNRLVADELEGQWNSKLHLLEQAQEEYERRREADRLRLDETMRARVLALATDVPRLWRDPLTPQRERKQMVRLLIEDATALKTDAGIALHVRFKGGATRSVMLPAPRAAWQLRQTPPEVVAEIDRLLADHTYGEIAAQLNERGVASGTGRSFHGDRVKTICRAYGLKPRLQRLREAGLLTLEEAAAMLRRSTETLKLMRRQGRLPVAVRKLDDSGRYMYEPPSASAVPSDIDAAARSNGVQYER
jgi:DNA invertase Pin-like site-specific DNA recombinase